SVFLGDGTGAFGPPIDVFVDNYAIFASGAGDIDEDGLADVIFSGSRGTYYRAGRRDGSLGPYVQIPFFGGPSALRVIDLNADHHEDGHVDLAIAYPFGGDVALLKGDGAGRFNVVPRVSAAAWDLAVADFDGYGHLDLATISDGGHDVQVSRALAPGSFASPL